jgi:hypothetical protein
MWLQPIRRRVPQIPSQDLEDTRKPAIAGIGLEIKALPAQLEQPGHKPILHVLL